MEIIGWITILALCALALTFITLELGPVIHSEVSSWSIRREKSLEAKADKAKFKKEMRLLKYEAKKLKFIEKNNLNISTVNVVEDESITNDNNTIIDVDEACPTLMDENITLNNESVTIEENVANPIDTSKEEVVNIVVDDDNNNENLESNLQLKENELITSANEVKVKKSRVRRTKNEKTI